MNIKNCPSAQRRELLRRCVQDVVKPQRQLLLGYRDETCQSAQLSDGYVSQMLASIVVGVPGHRRRGKSGTYSGDLADGSEVKSANRVDQLNGKEDSHVNFGMLKPEKLEAFTRKTRIIVVHQAYDPYGHVKIEVLSLVPSSPAFRRGVSDFLARSQVRGTARPQLQPRLYPDNVRTRLQLREGAFHALGARLLARVAIVGDDVVVDKWNPEQGLDLEECLDPLPGAAMSRPSAAVPVINSAEAFVADCMIRWRRSLLPYCDMTNSSQNIGYGYLAQHLVSLVTGTPGSGAAARGDDLIDGSEVKLAMGYQNDEIGTEGQPRLNLQKNKQKILGWTNLYATRIVVEDDLFKVKVLKPDMKRFRAQVDSYFGTGSIYVDSDNMQYVASADWDDHVYRGHMGDGSPRLLQMDVIFHAEESPGGTVEIY